MSTQSIEKALQVVSSCLQDKAACMATDTMGWILLTALKANMGNALPDAARVHREYYKDVRSGELLEKKQCTLLLTPWGGLY